jgi:hypothetical protein
MSLTAFSALPDEARLWLLALAQPTEASVLAPEMDGLLGRWRNPLWPGDLRVAPSTACCAA